MLQVHVHNFVHDWKWHFVPCTWAIFLHIQMSGTIHLLTRFSSRPGVYKACSAWKKDFLAFWEISVTSCKILYAFSFEICPMVFSICILQLLKSERTMYQMHKSCIILSEYTNTTKRSSEIGSTVLILTFLKLLMDCFWPRPISA